MQSLVLKWRVPGPGVTFHLRERAAVGHLFGQVVGMAPKRKAMATAAKTKAESSAPKKSKASKDAEPCVAAAIVAAASDGKKLSLVIEAW